MYVGDFRAGENENELDVELEVEVEVEGMRFSSDAGMTSQRQLSAGECRQ